MKKILALMMFGAMLLPSCSDMLDTDSDLVEFEKDNKLNTPTDSLYSVMGIVYKMQSIADRTLLLGEVRGDLVKTTYSASTDLKNLSLFDVSGDNTYNKISDYYAVINNCNFFLAHADTTLTRRGRKIFRSEYAAVKAYRAWTYLQLAQIYGKVPLITKPLMSEKEAEKEKNKPYSDMNAICEYFINDLTPYVDVPEPQYRSIGNVDSRTLFIPVRVMLGDLCLWSGKYKEAAQWYHDYLTQKNEEHAVGNTRIQWIYTGGLFNSYIDGYAFSIDNYVVTSIPMEEQKFDGIVSDLDNIFNSSSENNYYFQVAPSDALLNLSAKQTYCFEYRNDAKIDTIFVPEQQGLLRGDLRLKSYYQQISVVKDIYSDYADIGQGILKISSNSVALYRIPLIYLRYAEALNRAGYPQSAFAILKYGLYSDMMNEHIDSVELAEAGNLVTFDKNYFNESNTIGIHSFGSGDSYANDRYAMPVPATALASRADSVAYQIPLVEDLIVDEMALETAFEGYRYYDLMRIAMHRNDPSYLAERIAMRDGKKNQSLFDKLMNKDNWYLPIK